ncbi:hypothetical protein WJX74_010122 [Apatococcus lobatus]|uniref:Uncharacterized protein n=1 Tax=Apatococcus lobatus TaxID=904363 RepID=A0AAW1RKD1_9CHLO
MLQGYIPSARSGTETLRNAEASRSLQISYPSNATLQAAIESTRLHLKLLLMGRSNSRTSLPSAEQWHKKLRAECFSRIKQEREKELWKKRSSVSPAAARQACSSIVEDVSKQLLASFDAALCLEDWWHEPTGKDASRLPEEDYVELMQHLEQSLLDEGAQEEAEELQRLEQEDIDSIISSMLDDQGKLQLALEDSEQPSSSAAQH